MAVGGQRDLLIGENSFDQSKSRREFREEEGPLSIGDVRERERDVVVLNKACL